MPSAWRGLRRRRGVLQLAAAMAVGLVASVLAPALTSAGGPVGCESAVGGCPDVTAPTVMIGAPPPDAIYEHKQVVNALFTCADEDGGSGIDTCEGPVPTGTPIDTSTLGHHDFSVTATDIAGNQSQAELTYTVVDVTPPTATITTPGDGAVYPRNQSVAADFGCADEQDGSGIDTCEGSVPFDAPIDTGTLGEHEFTVTAADITGNQSEATHSYTVARHRPDNMIRRRNQGISAYSGNNIYNANGAGQSRFARVRRGVAAHFFIRIQSDGSVDDSFTIRGGGSTSRWRVTYFRGTTNISGAVKAGTYLVDDLARGRSVAIQAVVKARRRARIGNVGTVAITSTSLADPGVMDTVRAATRLR